MMINLCFSNQQLLVHVCIYNSVKSYICMIHKFFFGEEIATGYMKFQFFASIPSWIEICPIRVFNVKQHFVGGNKPLNHETILVDQAA